MSPSNPLFWLIFLVFIIAFVAILFILGALLLAFLRLYPKVLSGNPDEIKEASKSLSPLFGSAGDDDFWQKVYGETLENLGTVEQPVMLWGQKRPIYYYTLYLTRTEEGEQILLHVNTTAKQQRSHEYCPLGRYACQQLADILEPDEATFLRRATQYKQEALLTRPPTWESGIWNRFKTWFQDRFYFHPLKDFGLIQERRQKYPMFLRKNAVWEQTVQPYMGEIQDELLLILKVKTISGDYSVRWYPFSAVGRDALRKAFQMI